MQRSVPSTIREALQETCTRISLARIWFANHIPFSLALLSPSGALPVASLLSSVPSLLSPMPIPRSESTRSSVSRRTGWSWVGPPLEKDTSRSRVDIVSGLADSLKGIQMSLDEHGLDGTSDFLWARLLAYPVHQIHHGAPDERRCLASSKSSWVPPARTNVSLRENCATHHLLEWAAIIVTMATIIVYSL